MRSAQLCWLVAAFLITACAPLKNPSDATETLTVLTHDSFAVSESVIKDFEKANNAKVDFIKAGDAGEMLNKAILSRNAPLADVMYGVDNTFLARALDADIYQPYDSPELASIPVSLKLDGTHRALPVDFGDVCINYDRAYFEAHDLAVPETLEELTRSAYRGLLVVENPATSSTGMAFLLATIRQFGDPGYKQFWADLRANGVIAVDGWTTAYYTNFSGSSGKGPQPLVVSYATSPAAEVMFAPTPLTASPIGSILSRGTCFRQVEFVGILKGAKHDALARKFVDFMLGEQFQADVPGQMFVYPSRSGVAVPPEFSRFAPNPIEPAMLPPGLIAFNRDAWIQSWTDVVLH